VSSFMPCLFVPWQAHFVNVPYNTEWSHNSFPARREVQCFFAGLKHWIFVCQSCNHYTITSHGKFSVLSGAHRNERQNMCILSITHNLKRTATNFYVRPCVCKIYCLSSARHGTFLCSVTGLRLRRNWYNTRIRLSTTK
jgi:hypothetical protein